MMSQVKPPGATCLGADKTSFSVWAPFVNGVDAHVVLPEERVLRLEKDASGYFTATARRVTAR
ncbi:MAG: hypothetical protein A2137_07240 [Chloroflexi bacterium RBG_16_58_8]|nr:MAG: hypothetical protein A2137_07240 [Chloroflexi bacterium RBG_16_58_8]